LNPNATLIGTIYSPTATVSVGSNWQNFGAITAQGIVVSSNVHLHFDESLLSQGVRAACTSSSSSGSGSPCPSR
jgi:hypothetical protein